MRFLFKGYHYKFYYWEIVLFSRKFFIILIGSMNYFFHSSTKPTILLLVLSFYLLLQTKFRPFETLDLNRVEFLSLLVSFLTSNIGVLLFTDDFRAYPIPLLVFVSLINSAFFIFWISVCCKEFFRRVTTIGSNNQQIH